MLHPTPLADLLTETPRRVGRRWVWSDGTSVPAVAGGNGEAPPAADPPAGDPPKSPAGDPSPASDPAPAPGAALTQADVDRAKRDAKKATYAEVAATLGCTVEEAKALVDAKKAADDQQKTEAQRAKEAADAEKATAAEERRTIAAERRALRTERALLAAKVNDGRLDKAAKLVLADLADDADDDAITAAVATFKTDTPEWFTTGPVAPGSDPQGRGPGGGAGGQQTGMDAGRQRSIDRKASQPAANADPLGAFAKLG